MKQSSNNTPKKAGFGVIPPSPPVFLIDLGTMRALKKEINHDVGIDNVRLNCKKYTTLYEILFFQLTFE